MFVVASLSNIDHIQFLLTSLGSHSRSDGPGFHLLLTGIESIMSPLYRSWHAFEMGATWHKCKELSDKKESIAKDWVEYLVFDRGKKVR